MIRKTTLDKAFDAIEKPWSPVIAGRVNDTAVKIARIEGTFIWHKHDDEDEFFLVHQGRLKMRLRDQDIVLEAGECVTIPRGVEHCPVALSDPCYILMVEPTTTINTGGVVNDLTVTDLQEAEPT